MGQHNATQLLARVMRGDRAALAGLLELHQDRVFNTILRMVNDREDAAELTQDTLVKVITHIKDYNGKCQFSTWITRIAMNLAISHLRKRKLRRHASLEAPLGGSDDSPHSLRDHLSDSGNIDPAQCVERLETLTHLQQAMDRLEPDFRSVLVLRDIQELDYQQISEVLELPVGTVKSRLFRARLALRQQLGRIYPSASRPRGKSVNPAPATPAPADRAEVTDA